MAKRIEVVGPCLGREALVLEVGSVDSLAVLGAAGLGRKLSFHGFLERPVAVAALGVASAVPAIGLLLPYVVVLIDEVVLMLAIGIIVGKHLAARVHEFTVDGHVAAPGVVARLAAETEQLSARGFVAFGRDCIISGEVYDVLVVAHIRVVDVQRLLVKAQKSLRIERAIAHVHGDVVFARAGIGVDIDDLAARVERAAIERHNRRAVGPNRIVAVRGVKRRVRECGALVTPVEGFAVDDATVDHGFVGANEAEIVGAAGTKRHVLERHGTGAVKGVVAIVLSAEIGGIGHLCTDVPACLIGA